jgi:hypothetical protein
LKQKLAKVYELITKTEEFLERIVKRKVKFYEDDYKFTDTERELIKKVKEEYSSFYSDLWSAMPKTDEQRLLDIKELESTISILESFDTETYEDKEKTHDAGTGIFYDKMSRKFIYIIDKNKLTEYKFIPIQSIKFHAFLTIKNIKNEDFIPVLNIMKETNLISNIVEINPQFHIIVFNDEEKLDLTIPEKVLLSFAYDEDILTVQKLVDLTEWKEDYANSVIMGLKEKGILTIDDDKLSVKNFGRIEERRKWNKIIQENVEKEKEKEEKKIKQQLERAAQLEEKLMRKKEIYSIEKPIYEPEKEEYQKEIKFKEKPTVKELPSKKEKAENSMAMAYEKSNIKNKKDLSSTIKALDDIMPTETSVPKESKQEDIEARDIQDLIAEEILNYHEKFSVINGNFSQYEKIEEYLDERLENVPRDLLKKMLEQLKSLELIYDSIKIGNHEFYLFSEIFLSENEKSIIEYAANKKPMIMDQFILGLNWDENRVLDTIKSLEQKDIVNIKENLIIIPGIIQQE